MHELLDAFIFCLGAIVGSFPNVCIHRMPREESIVSPPSHCPRCNAPIKPYDNIPILSYIILAGRCRACKAPISIRYPAVELLTALCFLGLWIFYAAAIPMAVVAIMFVASLIVVIFVDFEHQIIPDEISLGGIGFGIAASLVYPPLHGVHTWQASIVRSLAGLVVGGGIFWLIRIIGTRALKKEAMGFGDVKLMAYFGTLLGPALILLTTFFASLIGSAVGLTLIASGRARLGSRLPFGPYLCAAAVIALLFGNQCISWYLGKLDMKTF
ncbi:MAG: prepilin peptidase [Candidatus Aureabacteria bacterium]|nr:prepilin peptidase [Candidatus Auribacterota bacterium]